MQTHFIRAGSKILGYIAIDSTVAGRARGGLRLVPDLSEAEIAAAARSMTLKYGLLGLPQGGAKAGIHGDPEAPPEERRQRLHAFARAATPFLHDRRYIPDADIGTTATEVRDMMRSIDARVGPRDWRANLSGAYTAWSVMASAEALFTHIGRPLRGARVAIEGFGKVGSVLAKLLQGRGAVIVAASTSHGAVYEPGGLDLERLALGSAAGDRMAPGPPALMERSRLLELPVDLLCPCARFESLHAGNVERVQAQAICAGANNPFTADALAVLEARGVHCLPDFVTNSGGVLGGTLEFAGLQPAEIGPQIEIVLGDVVRTLLDRARAEVVSATALAEREALARHDRVRHAAEHPGPAARLSQLGLALYRRGWFPARVMARLAPAAIRRAMAA